MYAFWDYWLIAGKCTYDGINKVITVNTGVTSLDIRADVYSGWIRWIALYDNTKYLEAFRYTGLDPIGGGKFTGDIYFLKNGWKIQLDLTKVQITGVLLSDNYDTPYYSYSGTAQYPAVVSSLVTTVQVSVPNPIDVPALVTDVTDSVWNKATAVTSSGSFGELVARRLLTVGKYLGLK